MEMRKAEKGRTSVGELNRVIKQREQQKRAGTAHVRLE